MNWNLLTLIVLLSICFCAACGTDDVNRTTRDAGQHEDVADTRDDVDADSDAGCVPQTCEQLGAECGTIDNGCGTPIGCGSCADGEACGQDDQANTCVCGGESAAELCSQEGIGCGEITVTDSCGVERTVDCGSCADDETCNSANVCECTGETEEVLCAREAAVECGEVTVTDACGNERTIYCGGCGSQERCAENNRCECAPYQCGGPFTSCGLNDDGCGGQIFCAEGCNQVLALGGHHTCLADSAGGMHCWGRNNDGQVGDASFDDRHSLTPVSGITDKVYALAAGEKHTCAHVAGQVYCWGDHKEKQIGEHSDDQNAPVAITGFGAQVSSLGSGNFHGCGTHNLSGLYCWGRNDFGQLGNGQATWREPDPLEVQFPTPAPSQLVKVDGGPLYTCALDDIGVLYCWGESTFGQVGTGQTADDPPSPIVVQGIDQAVVDFSAGGWFGSGSGSGAGYSSITGFTCAVLADGSVHCWGANIIGQLGIGTDDNYKPLPTQVAGLNSGAVQVSNGADHACALMDDGSVKCWGWNKWGQLGDGTNDHSNVPVDVTGLNGPAVELIAGGFHTCAALASGELQCWGKNSNGQLGDGTTVDRNVPVTVIP